MDLTTTAEFYSIGQAKIKSRIESEIPFVVFSPIQILQTIRKSEGGHFLTNHGISFHSRDKAS